MKYRLLLLPLALAACASTPASDKHPTNPAPAASVATPDATLLSGYHWQLSAATNHTGARIATLFARPDKPVQLDFMSGRIGVRNTCNSMSGGYRIEAGQLKVGPMMHTMMACANPALMMLDQQISSRLHANPTITVQPGGTAPQLQLVTQSGDTLVFTGLPTPETRYGGPGVIEFLEVAAQTVPCNHPLMPNKSCLDVRERHYDANGLKAGVSGAWYPLQQDIEGYTHEAGIRNVLRVKRYTIKNPPADAPNSALVLDSVIESEIVKH